MLNTADVAAAVHLYLVAYTCYYRKIAIILSLMHWSLFAIELCATDVTMMTSKCVCIYHYVHPTSETCI
jgi:hypothetical protein